MIAELLILSVLKEKENTIYGIRKTINQEFSAFCGSSLGNIYPALQKLHKKGCLDVKKSMSKGGQRSSVYSITKQGRKYFKEIMVETLPDIPLFSDQLARIKIFIAPTMEKDHRTLVFKTVKEYYQGRLLAFQLFKESCSSLTEKNNMNYLNRIIAEITDDINWLKIQD